MAWFSGKYFPFILGGKHFSEVVKKLEISYYLLIILNLVLKLLIAIYFILNLFFPILSFRIWFDLIFILTFVLIFMIVIYFSLIIFLIDFFYLSNSVFILLIVTYFIWSKLWNCNCYYFNFTIFQFFLSIRFNLYYFDCYLFYLRSFMKWDFFFQFHSFQHFNL